MGRVLAGFSGENHGVELLKAERAMISVIFSLNMAFFFSMLFSFQCDIFIRPESNFLFPECNDLYSPVLPTTFSRVLIAYTAKIVVFI